MVVVSALVVVGTESSAPVASGPTKMVVVRSMVSITLEVTVITTSSRLLTGAAKVEEKKREDESARIPKVFIVDMEFSCGSCVGAVEAVFIRIDRRI